MPQRESIFEKNLVQTILEMFPGSYVLKMFPGYIQGFPDRLIIYQDHWAALEVKRTKFSSHQPNQDYYIDTLNRMSYARFVYPENKEDVLHEIQRAFRINRTARLLKR